VYYKHSGHFGVGGLAVASATGGAAALFLAYVYAHGLILIPEAHAAVFATIAFGALAGGSTGYGLIWGKVRNEPVAIAATGAVSALALYTSWAIWVPAILESQHLHPVGWTKFALRPGVLWHTMCLINQYGTWSLSSGGEVTNGWALWGIWGLEAAFVVGIAVSTGLSIVNHRPFCETCEVWAVRGARLILVPPQNLSQLKLQLESNDFHSLEKLGPGNGTGDHLIAVLDSCERCHQLHTMSLTHVTIRRSRLGKPTIRKKMIVQHLLVGSGQAETLRQLSEKVRLTAKLNPPTAKAAAAGKK
jgi:hypothetical protein